MSITLTMPRLSDTMEAGTIVRWNAKEGDRVASGSALADIETDKATMEMQVYDDGVLARILVPVGQQVAIGTPIALIAEAGEDPAAVRTAGGASPTVIAPAPPALSADAEPSGAEGGGRASPMARRLAEEHHVDLSRVRGTGPGGRIIKRDVLAAAGLGDEVTPTAAAEPAPMSAARPVSAVPATAGAIVPIQPVPMTAPVATGREVALSSMRQTIARRLVESTTSIPHYQVSMRFSMDALLELRGMLNGQLEVQAVKLSVNDFIVRACAIAMQAHPFFNASWAGDRIVIHGAVNIGVAVSLPADRGGGLVVATIRNADQKGLRQISIETRALAEKARSRGLSIEEMSDATFTMSNLGMFGVDNFTAIINPPNSAILACGGAIEQPVVRNHQLVVGHEMTATLSLDHRVIDGAMAAEFLQTVQHNIENPATLLV